MAENVKKTESHHKPQRGELYECCECGMQVVITKSCGCDDDPACHPVLKCCGKNLSLEC
jgi:hypothetical protein